MKRNENYLMHEVAGKTMIVPVGDACREFNGMLTVNETGKFLWEQLAAETTEEKLLEAILAEYDVAAEIARNDIAAFLEALRKAKALQE